MKRPYGWGVNVPWEASNSAELWKTQQALEILQPDCWMDYWCEEPVKFPGYVPTVRSRHLSANVIPDAVRQRLLANPQGETWLLFNEGHLAEQDDCTPEAAVDMALRFVNFAHDVGSLVNHCGPNAAINMDAQRGGLSGQEWHREYLRLCRAQSISEPSLVGIHTYHNTDRHMAESTWRTLRDEWRWHWLGMRKPVIITEGCAENQPLEEQKGVMDFYFHLLQIGLSEGLAGENGIMGAFWFITHHHTSWPNCALTEVDPTKVRTMRLTPLGEHWLELKRRL